MKIPRTFVRSSIAIFASGLFAAAALAGPSPHFMNRMAAKLVAKPAPVKMEEHPTGNCDRCKTARVRAVSDSRPAGKGAASKGVRSARLAGYSHSCTGCVGKNTTRNGKAKANMKHSDGCAKLACCK